MEVPVLHHVHHTSDLSHVLAAAHRLVAKALAKRVPLADLVRLLSACMRYMSHAALGCNESLVLTSLLQLGDVVHILHPELRAEHVSGHGVQRSRVLGLELHPEASRLLCVLQ
jgi:hypothetical protein